MSYIWPAVWLLRCLADSHWIQLQVKFSNHRLFYSGRFHSWTQCVHSKQLILCHQWSLLIMISYFSTCSLSGYLSAYHYLNCFHFPDFCGHPAAACWLIGQHWMSPHCEDNWNPGAFLKVALTLCLRLQLLCESWFSEILQLRMCLSESGCIVPGPCNTMIFIQRWI